MSRSDPFTAIARARGFTLIELLVTLAILALLATVTLPVAQVEVQRHREEELRRSLRELRQAIDAYKLAYDQGRIAHAVGASGYPPTLEVLVDGVEDVRDPDRHRIRFLRRIPEDPMQTGTEAERTSWGKRSYASDADDPQEGDDIYDVYTRSTGVGLNGIAYRRW
ncbi:MAG TPA: type II secretion system protein [Burkholderiaceae bacterium]